VHFAGEVVATAVADDDQAHLAAYRWRLHPKGYAFRVQWANGRSHTILLHRDVMGLTAGDGREVDHIDRDKLNCARGNLRLVTHAQNQQNFAPTGNSTWRGQPTTSDLRGVSFDRRRGKWKATVTVAGRTHHLGRFDTADEAGRVADAFRAQHMTHAAPALTTTEAARA
jgi:hypothetical protein